MSWVRRVSVRTSPIHGRGVFARKRIREDEYIGTFHGKVTKRDGPYVLWTLHDDGSMQGIRGTGVLRYLNHSKTPNAEFQGADLYALSNIQSGQEITLHYGDDWEE